MKHLETWNFVIKYDKKMENRTAVSNWFIFIRKAWKHIAMDKSFVKNSYLKLY